MKQAITIFSLSILLFTCKQHVDNSCGYAYIGGEIINPSSEFVVLRDAKHVLDTIYLDGDNRFSYQVDNLNPGLHSFTHGSEGQLILIEPNDSILIRLNTLDFDESLVFSGHGGKKNNYLISLYNTIQSEIQVNFNFSKLEPSKFQSMLDSMKNYKYEKLNAFNDKYDHSSLFRKISKATIDYNYYVNKELYHSRHFGNNKAVDHSLLPEDFYNFRSSIDYNDTDLEVFHLYNSFLYPHFNNLAADRYFETYGGDIFNRNNVEYNLIKLQLMDSLLHNESIKNNLIRFSTRNYLSRNVPLAESKRVFNSFLEKSTDEEDIDFIKNFYRTVERLQPGATFPEIEIVDTKGKGTTINSLSKKPTVIYFWRNVFKDHFINSHKKAEQLREDYPNTTIIAINIDETSNYVWKRNLKQNGFDLTNEYKFRDPEIARRLLAISFVSKVMVIDQNGVIVNSNTNLFRQGLLNTLKKL